MTSEQEKQIKTKARELKKFLMDFYGKITFNLSGSKNDIKISVEQFMIEDGK